MKNKRPKMQFLENAFNEIVTTIGYRPAESGGLLFGKEDDYIVRKFVFDKHAKVTGSTYTFNTDFLNPEIKRLWEEESLSCIGFIHSHPKGYGKLSQPDIEYFNSMFKCMPRKKYLTPIVFTIPDGGFKLNAFILPNGLKETIKADVEILPDDYFSPVLTPDNFEIIAPILKDSKRDDSILNITRIIEKITWGLWKLILAFGLSWFLLKTLYIITNNLHKILPL